jgi:hypothetical protein
MQSSHFEFKRFIYECLSEEMKLDEETTWSTLERVTPQKPPPTFPSYFALTKTLFVTPPPKTKSPSNTWELITSRDDNAIRTISPLSNVP